MIWITQAQYDAITMSISKVAITDDLRDVAIYVPPIGLRVQIAPMPAPNYIVPIARFRPVQIYSSQSSLLPPTYRWELVTPYQIVPDFVAIQMQSR